MEIPVIHEITRVGSRTPHTAPVLVSSSSISTTNHFLHHGRAPILSQNSLPEGTAGTGMHREQLILTSSKPKTPAKPVFRKPDDGAVKSPQRSLHTRLPSADSGIQADGGFDSLSRYRGKTFLSASSTSDSISTDASGSKSSSGPSSGYSSDHQGSPVTHVVSIPSKSFFSPPKSGASPPIPAVRNSLTSQNPLVSQDLLASQNSASGNSHNVPREFSNGFSPSSQSSSRDSSQHSHSTTLDLTSGVYTNTPSSNQKSGSLNPLDYRKTDYVISTANQNKEITESSTTNQKSSSDPSYVKMSPSVKVVSNPGAVKLDFIKNSVNISSVEGASNSDKNPTLQTRSSNSTAPGSTFKVHVINAPRPSLGQQDNAKNRGQGCIALTRPLRLGTPSQPTARSAPPQPPQPHQPTPAARNTDTVSQQQNPLSSSGRAKPKIAPRPTIAPKPSPNSSPSKVSDRPASSTTTSTTVTFTKNSSADLNASTHKETVHITEIPVNYRPSTPNSQTGRKEIPVKHMENITVANNKPQVSQLNPSRPKSLGSSFSRLTPERDRQRQSFYDRRTPEKDRIRQNHQNNKQPIYENMFSVKDGFSFDDQSTRMKQAELILKQSDELINDALKMLSASPSPMASPKTKKNGISPEVHEFQERIVEGSDAAVTPEQEHRVPVFDVQSGKFYGGNRAPSFSDVKASSSLSDGKVKDVSWNERKLRIDSALSWLHTELAGLRAMDNTLISQFKRCQETIDALKTQRDVWEGLSEEGEDGEYWDDYEISEFNRRYLDSPGGSSSSQFSPGSRDPSLQDVSSISFPVPQLQLPQVRAYPGSSPNHVSSPSQDRSPSNRRGSVTQDIEVTL